jgi:processive 1,2-diacylglycerol beta-glucosyltransferase
MYFVPFEQVREDLISLGVSPQMVKTCGIPIDPVFAQSKDKSEMRLKHNLKTDLPTLLISAGGFGLLGVEKILSALSEVSCSLQIIAVCGVDRSLLLRVQRLAAQLQQSTDGRLTVVPVGFTNTMDEYMSAADLMVGKAGGLTTSEALCKRLPFVVINPIPGQEECNSDFLVSNNAAVRCSLSNLAASVERLLADQARLSAMQESAGKLAHPDAARDIVRELLSVRHT